MSSFKIERISSVSQYEKFAALPFEVYSGRQAWWPPDVQNEVELLSGRNPIAVHLEMAPMWARRDSRILARVSAVLNHRYNRHWHEKLGQLIHFEAVPDERDAVVALLDQASAWLRSRGMTAVRSGFAAFLDYPYAIDHYGALPAFLLRGNPEYYHSYFKDAGFETEKGFTDYTAPLTPEILQRYTRMLAAAGPAGVRIQSWREFGFMAASDAWTDVTNSAFSRHW